MIFKLIILLKTINLKVINEIKLINTHVDY